MAVLEGGENILVWQAQIGVRVHVAVDIGEGAGEARMQRIAQIEEKGAAGVVIVGEEDAAGGHDVFGVVHEFGLLIGIERGKKLAVVRGRGRRVDDGEKVGLLARGIAGPNEEVVGRWFAGWSAGGRASDGTERQLTKSKARVRRSMRSYPGARGVRRLNWRLARIIERARAD